MDQEARFLISELMTSKPDKSYLTSGLQVNCNEFTIKGNVRHGGRFPDVNNTSRQVGLLILLQQPALQDFSGAYLDINIERSRRWPVASSLGANMGRKPVGLNWPSGFPSGPVPVC